MNSWLVIYWNGRAMREKFFGDKESAIRFMENTNDNKATLWQQKEIV